MLSVNNISVGYKGLLAIQDVSFEVKKGEVVSLIGSNGAGKTTLLKTILGLLKPIKGEIRLKDQVISGRKPYDVVKMKIALAPKDGGFSHASQFRTTSRWAHTQLIPMSKLRKRWSRYCDSFPGSENGLTSAPVRSPEANSSMWLLPAALCTPRFTYVGRTLPGGNAANGHRNLSHRRAHHQRRRNRALGGAERVSGPKGLPPGLCPTDRPNRHGRHRKRAVPIRPCPPGVPGNVIAGMFPWLSQALTGRVGVRSPDGPPRIPRIRQR